MALVSLVAWLLLSGGAAVEVPRSGETDTPSAPDDLTALLARAQEVQVADAAAWRRFEFPYSLRDLFRMSSYRYAGREDIDGVPCHRLHFSPAPDRPGDGIEARFARSMAGTVWFTVAGSHLLRARSRSVLPISLALSAVKIFTLELDLEAAAVPCGFFLPRRIEVVTVARVLVAPYRRRTIYTYSGFRPAAPAGGGDPCAGPSPFR